MLNLTVTDSTPVAAGIHPARLCWVVDLGVQTGPYGDKPKLILAFELPGEIMADGRPAVVSRTFTASLSPKASLRQALTALVGPLTTGATVGLKGLVGRPVMVTVAHKPRDDGGVRAFIEAIAAPGKYEIPPMVGPGLVFDQAAPDPVVLDQLPDWIKAAVALAKPVARPFAAAPVPTPAAVFQAPPAPPPPPAPAATHAAAPAPNAGTAFPDDDLDF
jgi:hypothetical protein